jgi:hypothetical protein
MATGAFTPGRLLDTNRVLTGQAVGQPGELQATTVGKDVLGQRAHLLPAQVITQRARHGLVGLDGVDPAALLQAEQHISDHQQRQAAETDLAATADRGLGPSPQLLVQLRIAAPWRRAAAAGARRSKRRCDDGGTCARGPPRSRPTP